MKERFESILTFELTMFMVCPLCKKELKKQVFYGVEIDYCEQCLGLWFEQDELREIKDEKDKNLNWLDIDLWRNKEKFRLVQGAKICPGCSVPLYEVGYSYAEAENESAVKVDICNLCQGIWLDRGEFREIIAYLKRVGYYEAVNNYFKNLIRETFEVFVGPEDFKSELGDFLTIFKLLNYKFTAKHPEISKIILDLPK